MEKIFDTELMLSKIDEKTHKKFYLDIEKEMSELIIKMEYFPKFTNNSKDIIEAFNKHRDNMNDKEFSYFIEKYLNGEDKLTNLITISLYNEDDYMGCGHRGINKQKIVISKAESTPGFKSTKVNKGKWEIVLSIHGFNTDKINVLLKAYVQ